MGWAAGSELGTDIYSKVREYIPDENREEVASFIYNAVRELDADDWDGSSDLEIDAKVPVSCWECENDFTADQLDEDHLCKNCKEEQEALDD